MGGGTIEGVVFACSWPRDPPRDMNDPSATFPYVIYMNSLLPSNTSPPPPDEAFRQAALFFLSSSFSELAGVDLTLKDVFFCVCSRDLCAFAKIPSPLQAAAVAPIYWHWFPLSSRFQHLAPPLPI